MDSAKPVDDPKLSEAEQEMLGSLTEEELEQMLQQEMAAKKKALESSAEVPALGSTPNLSLTELTAHSNDSIPAWLSIALSLLAGLGISSIIKGALPSKSPLQAVATAEPGSHSADHGHGSGDKDLAKHDQPSPKQQIQTECNQLNFGKAIELAENALAHAKGSEADSLRYNLALAREGNHEYEKAIGEYQKLLNDGNLKLRTVAAKLGEIRCRLHLHEIGDARKAIARLILLSGHESFEEYPFDEELFFLRNMAQLSELMPKQLPDPMRPDRLCTSFRQYPIQRFMAWDAAETEPEGHPVSISGDDSVTVRGQEQSFASKTISGKYQSVSVVALLRTVVKEAKLQLEISAELEAELAKEKLDLQLQGLELVDFLDAISDLYQLQWMQKNFQLRVERKEGNTAENTVLESVQRQIQRFPEHPGTLPLQIEQAGLLAKLQRHREALEVLKPVIEQNNETKEVTAALYLQGLAYLKINNRAQASKCFLEVADRDENVWSAAGFWWVGRIHLENFEMDAASERFNQGFKRGKKTEWAGSNVLGLAACDYLRKDYASAHEWIHLNRRILRRDGIREEAALIDTLACQENGSPLLRNPALQKEELAYAALNRDDAPLFGNVGIYLRGRAFQHLKMSDKVIELYEKHISGLRGQIAGKMAVILAEEYRHLGRDEDARKWYQAVQATQVEGPIAENARYELAKLALQRKDAKEVIAICQGLAKSEHLDRSDVLNLLGKAYEQLGQFELASRCFAGEELD